VSYSGETIHFTRLRELVLSDGKQKKSFSVERVRATGGHLLLKLEGLDAPEESRAFAGWEILVDRNDAAPLRANEYYHGDLCGCDAVKDGKRLGRILSVCEGGGGDMLEIQVPSGRCFFVPFREEFVGRVNVERGDVEIVADWLLR
jgi:16S rRNA processing protein RimM